MGEGRATLLELIEETGSIQAAANKMDMPMDKANKLVDIMNSAAPETVLELSDSNAQLTTFAKRLVAAYRIIQKESQQKMDDALRGLLP